jgi:hypothetical protein
MNAAKVFIDPNEDVVFAFSKINKAPVNRVIVVVPDGANVISSQVSLKLLSRIISTSEKTVVLVTEDELGSRFAASAFLTTVQKVSDVSAKVWKKAHELKQNQIEKQDKKKSELIKQHVESKKGKDFEIVEHSKSEEVADVAVLEQDEDLLNEGAASEIKQIAEGQGMARARKNRDAEKDVIEPLFTKLDPKIIENEQFVILSGGDISMEAEMAVEIKEKLLDIEKKKHGEQTDVENTATKENVASPKENTASPKEKKEPTDTGSPGSGDSSDTNSSASLTAVSSGSKKKSIEKKEVANTDKQEQEDRDLEESQNTSPIITPKKLVKPNDKPYEKPLSQRRKAKVDEIVKEQQEKRAEHAKKKASLTNMNFAGSFGRKSMSARLDDRKRSAPVVREPNRDAGPSLVAEYWKTIRETAGRYWSKLGGSAKQKIAIAGVVFLIIVLVLSVTVFSSADVSVKVSQSSVSLQEKITAKESATAIDKANLLIPMSKISKTDSRSETAEATGEADGGTKATGSVKVLNASDAPVSLEAGTVIVSVNTDLEYKLKTAVTVIGNGTLSGDVPIEAASFGEKYNLTSGKKDFTLKGKKIDGISISSYTGVSGGKTEKVTVVSQENYDNLKNELTNVLKASLKSDIEGLLSDAEVQLSENVIYSEPKVSANKQVGDEAESFDMTVEISAHIPVVAVADLKEIALEISKRNLGEDASFDVKKMENPTVTNVELEGGQARFDIVSKADIAGKVTEDDIRRQVLGLSTDDAKSQLEGLESVQEADLSFSPGFLPGFLRRIPQDEGKVTVRIEEE